MVSALTHPNEWYFRRAVRRIAHAATSETKTLQIPDVKPTDPPAWHLRRLLMLGAVGQMDRVRKSGPFPPDSGGKTLSLTVDLENLVAVASAAELGRRLLEEIRVAEHPLTLMRLAWYLKDCDPADAAQGMALLLGKKELIGDARAELVLWHNWEAIFERTAPVILPANSPAKLVNFAARRSHAVGSDSAHLRSLMQQVSTWPQKPLQAAALDGLLEASNGRTGLAAPSGWAAFRDALQSGHPTAITRLALAFGDESVAVKLAALVKNRSAAAQERRDALQALAVCRSPLAAESVRLAMQDSDLRPTAIPQLAVLSESEVETLLWPIWPTLGAAEKSAAIDVLTTRRSWAKSLLAKVADAVVSQKEISLGQARQISLLKDAGVNVLLEKHWGKVGASRKDHEDAIAKYRMMLTANKTASAERGHVVYGKACAVCHKLFGEGGSLGPDLTGSGRKELDYLLLNVINPNAAVPRDYQMIVVEMKDGQVLTGTMPREDETSVTLQTLTEKRILNRSELRKVERQSLSWMPEGLFQQLTDQEVADLVAYLRKE
jgi:putative heme-binding domain-containing protein